LPEKPICDFCSDPNITRDFKTRTFTFSYFPIWGSQGDWAACDTCAALVDAGKWDELLDRSMLGFYRELTPEELSVIRPLVGQLHQEFNQNRIKEESIATQGKTNTETTAN
jgi:hypothetical protein